MTEVFYTKDSTKYELLVETQYTDMIDDCMVVSYDGEFYTLYWNLTYSYYEGRIDGLDGFVV